MHGCKAHLVAITCEPGACACELLAPTFFCLCPRFVSLRDSLHSGGWVGSGVQCVNTSYFKLPEVMGLDPYRRVCARCILSSSAVTVAVGQVYVGEFRICIHSCCGPSVRE